MKDFKLPELGENITTADVLKVLVSAGDKIKQDQVVLEIETDKATIEVPSDVTGIVKEVFVKQGDKAKVGQVIFTLEDVNSANEDKSEKQEQKDVKIESVKKTETENKPGSKTSVTAGLVKFKLPELGENILSADVLSVKVAVGDKLEKDQVVLEIETDKATVEVPSDIAGVVKEIHIKAGDKVKVGQDVLTIETAGSIIIEKANEVNPLSPINEEIKVQTETKAGTQKVYIEEKPSVDPSKIAPAAPTVRRFAREIGVDINKVIGSGPGGRISINDVKAFSQELNRQKEAKPEQKFYGGIITEQIPDFSKWGEIEKKEMGNIRRKTAEHLSFAWATIPHVTQFDKADITELEKLRKMYSKHVENAGGKLTVTAVLIKIITSALKTFPQFNSSIDIANNTVIYKKYFNIGVAVDTEFGLLVPVIKNADRKNIIELSVEMNLLAEKARNKKLSLEEMNGGTFTITNLGGIGGTYFTPIINSPEVAILGVSRGSLEQVYIDGKFEPRQMLPLSLSYDHRIIDGADAIRFLRWIIGAIQQPFLMALEG
ncbi:MAG: 2-oxo acid dehydrogenase subunit E2 [Ignavibacteriales bacterium]|nr:2-oxo acid dehydrogenase subunit E2 [Ignavibacteriales bacterium]